jgi:hypothetical protein
MDNHKMMERVKIFTTNLLSAIYDAQIKKDLNKLRDELPISAFEKLNERIEALIKVDTETSTRLTDVQFNIELIKVREAENFIYLEIEERYSEKYEKAKGGHAYNTEGVRGYLIKIDLGKNAKNWQVDDVVITDFLDIEPSPPDNLKLHLIDDGDFYDRGATILDLEMFWAWNGEKASLYSDKWALARNPTYRSYSNDCTNFVSQCLAAGGKTETGSVIDRKKDEVWFYGILEGTTAYTWAGAQNLKRHLVEHTNSTSESTFDNLRIGDIIFIDPNGGSGTWHGMVVAAVEANDLLMSYHSRDTKRKSFRRITATTPPHKKFWYLKIGDNYS